MTIIVVVWFVKEKILAWRNDPAPRAAIGSFIASLLESVGQLLSTFSTDTRLP
jgi:hypothetical protein